MPQPLREYTLGALHGSKGVMLQRLVFRQMDPFAMNSSGRLPLAILVYVPL